MTFAYPRLKATALDLIDDFSPLAILPRYGEDGGYSAKTRLDDIDITAPIRAVMIVRVNKVMGTALPAWRDVRPVDTVACSTIGDFIELLSKNGGIAVPGGEPK